MGYRCFATTALLAAFVVVGLLAQASLAGQVLPSVANAPPPTGKTVPVASKDWTPPRTPDGQPDL
jgi:hypothetical protein